MKQLQCKCCGAPLREVGYANYHCEYCGAVYTERNGVLETIRVVEVNQAHAKTIRAALEISHRFRENVPPEELSKLTIEELSNRLAKGLAAYMKIETREDPTMMATIVYGSVRVIPPDARF